MGQLTAKSRLGIAAVIWIFVIAVLLVLTKQFPDGFFANTPPLHTSASHQ